MCSICGCGSAEQHIEGDEHHQSHHPHHHSNQHDHKHSHQDHHHADEQPYSDNGLFQPIIIHHHYHHRGDIHHHYHYSSEPESRHEQHKLPVIDTPHDSPNSNQQQDLDYSQGDAGAHIPGMTQKRMLQIEMDVLSKNNHLAAHNREHFSEQKILVLNLVSSPGSGKTTLLTETLLKLKNQVACAVIEGDQQTTNDAERIRATGVAAIQVNTGKGCHLDAQMVHDAAHRLQLENNSILFIENVGNLVCPAAFDLGEKHKVAVLSVTEGEDKPLKYPHMFAASDMMLINKVDLLPYLTFNVNTCIENARKVNPDIQVIQVSASSGEGMNEWLNWLTDQLQV